jgi:hypothetical protein
VTAGDGDLDGGAREGLAADLGHVDRCRERHARRTEESGAQRALAAQRGDDLAQIVDRLHGDVVDDLGLGGAGRGDHDAAQPGGAREHRGGEHAAHRAHRAVEAELAEHEQAGERVDGDDALGDEHRERDRQVEAAAGLAQVGGREVDRDLLERQVMAHGLERTLDPGRAFAHRLRRQPDDAVLRQAAVDEALDVDQLGVDAHERTGLDGGDHAAAQSRSRATARL